MPRSILAMLLAGALAGGAAIPAFAQSSDEVSAPPPYPDVAIDLEPVAPSVWRALESEWDCGKAYPRQPFYDGAEVAADGRVWFLDRLRGVRALGSCPIVEPKPTFGIRDQALGPDGTLWLLNGDRLWSWGEGGWRMRLEGFNQPGRVDDGTGGYSYSTECETSPCYFSVDVAPDGSVWLAGSTLTAFDGTDTQDYLSGPAAIEVIGFDPQGRVWVRQGEALYLVEPTSPSAPDAMTSQPTKAPVTEPAHQPLASILGSLAGVTGEVGTWSGAEWVARLDPVMHDDANAIRGLEAVLDAAGTRAGDVTIATALVERTPGNYAAIAALRAPDSSVFDWLDAAILAMAPQIGRPLMDWDRVDDRSLVRVRDGEMPGVYPITFYPTGDTMWVLQADRSLVATILQDLPAQAGAPAPELRCDVLQGAFQPSSTTGDVGRDRDYLERCVTCDQLLDLLRFSRVADAQTAQTVLQERCGWSPGPAPTPAAEASLSETTPEMSTRHDDSADLWRVAVSGSSFAMRFPAGWHVEPDEQERDIYSAEPGTAWEALRASSDDGSMACVMAVGVTDLAPGQWVATGIDGVSTPYWDPDDATLLWIPTPTVERTKSVHSRDWVRRAQEDEALEHDVVYTLQCVADDDRFKDSDRAFRRLMDSLEFLPAEE